LARRTAVDPTRSVSRGLRTAAIRSFVAVHGDRRIEGNRPRAGKVPRALPIIWRRDPGHGSDASSGGTALGILAASAQHRPTTLGTKHHAPTEQAPKPAQLFSRGLVRQSPRHRPHKHRQQHAALAEFARHTTFVKNESAIIVRGIKRAANRLRIAIRKSDHGRGITRRRRSFTVSDWDGVTQERA
jgi:hypothetical protein